MIVSKYLEVVIVLIASVVAIYLGSHIVEFSIAELSILGALILVIVWALTAGDYWWVLMMTGATIEGMFRVGVKVYPTEVALALSFLGLLPLILIQDKNVFQSKRAPLPFIFYLTAGYISIRFMVDIIPAVGNRGNLGRVYFGAIWPFIFGFLFHHYAKLSIARTAFLFLHMLLFLRCSLAMAGFLFNIPLYIPGINYVLSFSSSDSLLAMREVALNLMLVALVFFQGARTYLFKFWNILVVGFGAVLVIMGSGRFAIVLMVAMPMAFFAWTRRYVAFGLALVAAVALIGTVNLFTDSLSTLPPFAQRSLSGLVLSSKTGIKDATKGSDEWHQALRTEGFDRWTQTPITVLFGYGVRPSPDLYETKSFVEDPKAIVGISANVGAYESALWTVLATIGLLGMILYTCLFITLGWRLYPYFRGRPVGTFWEGLLFWAGYTTIAWFLIMNIQGSYPSLPLLMMIIANAVAQEGKLDHDGVSATSMHSTTAAPLPYAAVR